MWIIASMCFVIVCLPPTLSNTNDSTIDEIFKSLESNVLLNSPGQNEIRVEMDIIMTTEEYAALISNDTVDTKTRKKRKAVIGRRWTDNTVPYSISTEFGVRDRNIIQKAMIYFTNYTCIKFRAKTSTDANSVHFTRGRGCSSHIGMSGGHQRISLAYGCVYFQIVLHELGHAVGLFHEQNRPERDTYITINTENIQYGREYNFYKYATNRIQNYGVPYDYRSIMHYGQRAFSRNGLNTITTHNAYYQRIIGRARQMSFRDLTLVNKMYTCAACFGKTCPEPGYLDKHCQCQCEGYPIAPCSRTTKKSKSSTTASTSDGSRTKAVTPSTTTPDPCKEDTVCTQWARNGYCTTYRRYMQRYCAGSCPTCTRQLCKNKKVLCPTWETFGYCKGIYKQFMNYNCPKSCRVCKGTTVNNCVDQYKACTQWKNSGLCDIKENLNYIKSVCAKTCGYCT